MSPVAARFDGVDLLRGFSILAVVLLHAKVRLFYTYGISIEQLMPQWVVRVLFTQGGNGVTVFFAISGFLITLTSLRRFGSLADLRPSRFYRIRFARIAPLFLAILVVLSVLHVANVDGFHIEPSLGTLPQVLFAALTFRLNWFEGQNGYLPANWDVMWSLSIEEMFYLFFPLACVLLLRRRRGIWLYVTVLLALIAMGPFGRTIWNATPIAQEKSYVAGMSDIAFGCLAALVMDWTERAKPRWVTARSLLGIQIVGAGAMILIVIWPHWHWLRVLGRSGTDDTLLSFATCLVMLGSVLRGRPGRRWLEPIRWLGRHSYEVYLTHEFAVIWLTQLYVTLHQGSLFMWITGELVVSAIVGAAVARWYSEPLNARLRGSKQLIAP